MSKELSLITIQNGTILVRTIELVKGKKPVTSEVTYRKVSKVIDNGGRCQVDLVGPRGETKEAVVYSLMSRDTSSLGDGRYSMPTNWGELSGNMSSYRLATGSEIETMVNGRINWSDEE